jgi:RNA-directed DNA polymerase
VNDSVWMSNPTGGVSDRRRPTPPALHDDLMAQVVDPANLQRAWKQVKANQGAPGIDGMPLEDFPAFAREHWPTVRQALLDGTYQPAPVRRVAIPKPGGRGERRLGIPTVLDRVISQAIAQVLMPLFDPDAPLMERSGRYSGTSVRGIASPWMWTWSSASTGSPMTCCLPAWPVRCAISVF